MMRIITGRAGGIRLDTLAGDNTRPTSERAKEAVFSMLQFDIEGREVLDLFSGSGQMGLEAISRGAVSATLVDKSKEAIAVIKRNSEKTKLSPYCRILCADVKDFIKTSREKSKYDIVFIDPPYALHAIADILSSLLDSGIVKKSAVIVCESEEADIFEASTELAKRFEIIKKAKYGVAHITLLKIAESEALL